MQASLGKAGRLWLTSLLSATRLTLPHASAQSLANTMWALGELVHTPPAPWLQAFLPAAEAQAERLSPQGLCCLLWGLVHADCRVVPVCVSSLTAAARKDVLSGRCTPLQLSTLLWAVAGLGGGAHPGLLHAALRVSPQHVVLGTRHLAIPRKRHAPIQAVQPLLVAAVAPTLVAWPATSSGSTATPWQPAFIAPFPSSTAGLIPPVAVVRRPVVRIIAAAAKLRASAWRRRMLYYLIHHTKPLTQQQQQAACAGLPTTQQQAPQAGPHATQQQAAQARPRVMQRSRQPPPHRSPWATPPPSPPPSPSRPTHSVASPIIPPQPQRMGTLALARLLHGLAHALAHLGSQQGSQPCVPGLLRNACVLALRATLHTPMGTRTLGVLLPAALALGVKPPLPPMRRALHRALRSFTPDLTPSLATLLAALSPMGGAAGAQWQVGAMQKLQSCTSHLSVGGVLQLARALPFLQAYSSSPSCPAAAAPAHKAALISLACALAARTVHFGSSMLEESDMGAVVVGMACVSKPGGSQAAHPTPLQTLLDALVTRVSSLPTTQLTHTISALAAHLPPSALPLSPALLQALEGATLARLASPELPGADKVRHMRCFLLIKMAPQDLQSAVMEPWPQAA